MATENLKKKLSDLQLENSALGQSYTGYTSLYNASCMTGNTEKCEHYRQCVLAVVECMLDNTASQFAIIRAMSDEEQ